MVELFRKRLVEALEAIGRSPSCGGCGLPDAPVWVSERLSLSEEAVVVLALARQRFPLTR